MKRTTIALAAALGLGACSKGAENTDEKGDVSLAALSERVTAMDQRLARIEEFLGPYLNRPPEPDPAAVYAVPIAGDPYSGPEHAKVTVVEAFEFACGYCAKMAPTLEQLLAAYPDTVKLVYKPFIVHPEVARVPALASCAAHAQGKFTAMAKLIWDKGFAARDLSNDKMTALATELGLDMQKFAADLAGPTCNQWVDDNQKLLGEVGVSGTPAFYVNGRFLGGALPLEALKQIVDEEIAKADAAIAAGTPLASYYQAEVLDKGLKRVE